MSAHRTIGVVILALLGSYCAARPASAPQTRARVEPANAAVVQLRRDLAALFTDPAIDHAHWSARVDSLATGQTLFAYNAHRLMVPASNQKLVTAAVAADRLGWDYRFTTRLMTRGTVDATGTLEGDLVVVGDGDPSINPRNPARWRVFDDWAKALREMGIRVVDGHLIGDDDLVDEPGWGEGWSWDDLQYGYGAPASALQYNENQIDVMVGPGLDVGAPAIVITSPLGSGFLVDNQAVTVTADAETKIAVSRLPGTTFLAIRGQIAESAKPVNALAAVENPTRLYVSALREALARHEIFIGGSAADIDELPIDRRRDGLGWRAPLKGVPNGRANLRELIVDRSPPLSEIIDVMLKWSRNGYAETLLTALSTLADESTPGTLGTLSAQSARSGLGVLRTTLETWGITKAASLSRDGSGLSRMDYVSADGLVTLLTRMWTNPMHREPFRAALPLAGVSGTLAERLKDTPAVGRVWAKTGSMSNVRTLSGYVETLAGEPIVFSILVNNFIVDPTDIDAVVDEALLKLVDLPRRPTRR